MTLNADIIIDRKRLKTRLNFWRILAIILLSLVVLIFSSRGFISKSDTIARFNISGVIINDPIQDQLLKKLQNNTSVKALIVNIDSPGGTFIGGEMLFKRLRQISEVKPVVSLLGGTATSAAYMTAIGADYIIAHSGTITGSIGVILQSADVTELMDKLGVKSQIIKSGDLKGQPSPFEIFSKDARIATAAVINDFFQIFVDMISERRSLQRDTVLKLADGRLLSGRMAKDLGLVDKIGSEKDALSWLHETYNIATSIPITDVINTKKQDIWEKITNNILGHTLISERLRLDGVLSLWHPTKNY